VDGRVVGVWDQRPDGEIRTHLFIPLSGAELAAVERRVSDLSEMVGSTRFTVRFPSPVSTALRA
jgi:hypothetical protein